MGEHSKRLPEASRRRREGVDDASGREPAPHNGILRDVDGIVVSHETAARHRCVRGEDSEGDGEDVLKLNRLVEKPSSHEAPSNLAISGRYLFDPAIFTFLQDQEEGVGNEIQLTDAAARLLQVAPVFGCVYEGVRYDVGDPAGYFEAQQAYNVKYGGT